jgi:hypothetical protein
MVISFAELRRRLPALDGERIEVTGRVASDLQDAWLVPADVPFEQWREQRVLLDFPRLGDLMLAQVPAAGGSELAYFEEAVVSGVVAVGGPDGSFATLHDIDRVEIEQRGRHYSVV